MNRKFAGTHLFTVLALMAFAPFATHAATGQGKCRADVEEATARFYSALNTMFKGGLAPMVEVWSHSADVTYMGPAGGIQVGWKKVIGEWKSQAAMKLGGTVEPKDMHITVGENIAVVQNYEEGTNVNAQGKSAKISIRATNIFRKEDGKWKMIGHHTDLLPYLAR